jgi:hypothetical protein
MIGPVSFTILLNVLLSFAGSAPEGGGKSVPPLLQRIYIDNDLFAEYTYTAGNKISEEKTKYLYIKYNYNENNQLISTLTCEDPSLVSSNAAIADAGRKKKEWVNPSNSVNNRKKTFQYDSKGILVKTVEDWGYSGFQYDHKNRICKQLIFNDGKLVRFVDYSYDRIGNLVKMTHYETDATGQQLIATTHEYEFDHKINIFRSFGLFMMPGKYTNPNNIVREVYTLYLTGKMQQETKTSYEYNESGYPVTVNSNMRYEYSLPATNLK